MSRILAFDAGATHTKAGLYDDAFNLLAEADGPPANPAEYGVAHTISALVALARQLIRERPAIVAGGISGLMASGACETVARALMAELGPERVLLTQDLHPIVFADSGHAPVLLAIAGTGSGVLAQNPGAWRHFGGRGHVFGDDGGAYQVAIAGLRAAAEAFDGAGPETALVEALPVAAGVLDFRALTRWSLQAAKSDVAALARTVDNSAETGDVVALDCIRNQAGALARLTGAAFRWLNAQPPVAVLMHGGMFDCSAAFREAYLTAVAGACPGLDPRRPRFSGHRAVAELARIREPVPDWLYVVSGPMAPHAESSPTEGLFDAAVPLDALSPLEMVRRMNAADARVHRAVAAAEQDIAAAVERAAAAITAGGRVIYVGAGTSGRLGVLDASECPPTFGVAPDRVLGIMAGGETALRNSVEGVEDDPEAARRDMAAIHPAVGAKDLVVGIAASGTTPYVLSALSESKRQGASTTLLCCNPRAERAADIMIRLDTGPEVVAGSTRLKAGTATKLVLNILSTCAMALSGHVYEGLMVNMRPVNAKLRRRAAAIVSRLARCTETEAAQALEQASWNIAVAVVMLRFRIDAGQAANRLARVNGRLRDALADD